MLEELRKLNFNGLIKVDIRDPENYSFKKYLENGEKHRLIGFCTSCEEKEINISIDDPEYKLQLISHGAHTKDFLESITEQIDTSDWHNEPILFIAETPSKDYEFYQQMISNGFEKKPTFQWYWVHSERKYYRYPDSFALGQYGELVCSIINTFKLKNAYFTNLVKCGLNDKNGNFKNIWSFKNECINNCFENYLKKELQILNPTVVFTIGNNTYKKLMELTKFGVTTLPHPASRGLKNDFFRVLVFWIVFKELHSKGILRAEEVSSLTDLFLNIPEPSEDVD